MKHLNEALSKSMIKKLEKHTNDKYLLVVPFNEAYDGNDFKSNQDYVIYYGQNKGTGTWFSIVKNGPEIEKLKKKVDYPFYYFYLYKFNNKYNSVTPIIRDINNEKIIVTQNPDNNIGLELIFGKEYIF